MFLVNFSKKALNLTGTVCNKRSVGFARNFSSLNSGRYGKDIIKGIKDGEVFAFSTRREAYLMLTFLTRLNGCNYYDNPTTVKEAANTVPVKLNDFFELLEKKKGKVNKQETTDMLTYLVAAGLNSNNSFTNLNDPAYIAAQAFLTKRNKLKKEELKNIASKMKEREEAMKKSAEEREKKNQEQSKKTIELMKAKAEEAKKVKEEAAKKEAPKVEEPKEEAPVVEEPKKEEPVVEEPKEEAPTVEDAPVIEEPTEDAPVTEEPKKEDIVVEEPKEEATEETTEEETSEEEAPKKTTKKAPSKGKKSKKK